jgi:hypothetical protein
MVIQRANLILFLESANFLPKNVCAVRRLSAPQRLQSCSSDMEKGAGKVL